MRFAFAAVLAAVSLSCASNPTPSLQPFDDGNDWVVLAPLEYRIGASGERIVVPAGFVTDFASVPRALCTLLPSTGTYLRAAIVHDFLYWDQSCTKEEADRILRAAMLDAAVPAWKREAIYLGVRAGGASAWKTNAENRQNGLLRVLPPRYRSIPDGMSWYNYRRQLAGIAEPSYARPSRAACTAATP